MVTTGDGDATDRRDMRARGGGQAQCRVLCVHDCAEAPQTARLVYFSARKPGS